MSSQQVNTPSPKKTVPKATKAPKKEKVVKEKVVKEKVVKEKKEKVEKKKEEVVEKAAAVEEEEVKEKTVRKSLPAKYNKFIQYTYYMLRTLNNAELENSGEVLFDEDKMFEVCHVFGEVEVQKAFVEGFLENKGIAKEMRTHLADKKKADKAAAKQKVLNDKAAEKQRKLDEKAAAKKAAADAKAEKKGGATKKKSKKEPVDLVTSLVTLANSNGEEEVKADEEEEEELDVKIITIEEKQYLIDEANNLYDSESHAQIGTWDCVTKQITTI